MKRKLSAIAILGLVLSGLSASPAQANTQVINCSISGTFTVTNNIVVSHSNCAGHANIPAGVTRISNSSSLLGFKDATLLTSVTIPSTVTIIGAEAFQGARALTSVTIPNSVTSIEHNAFRLATSLASITLPNSLTTIGESVFSSTALTSITIPSTVTSIGVSAFSSVRTLASITIPSSVTSIGMIAFVGSTALSSLTFLGPPPTVDMFAFQTLAPRARAVVSRAHIGTGVGKYGNVGSTWNGLRVSLPSSALSLNSEGTITTQVIEETFAPTNPQLTRAGFTLQGWSATQDGMATFAADLSDFTMGPTATSLFAVWQPLAPVVEVVVAEEETPVTQFAGTLIWSVDKRVFDSNSPSTMTLVGKRLHQITSASINGVKIEIKAKSRGSLVLAKPGMAPGRHTVVFETKSGTLTLPKFVIVE